MAGKKRYWHYTTLEHAGLIRSTGVIKTATIGVRRGVAHVAWFSINPVWEATICKTLLNSETGEKIELYTRDDFLKYGEPPVRIEVDPETANLRSWNNYKKNSGDDKQMINALEKTAKGLGANPKDWYVSYEDVPVKCVLSVEVWTGGDWTDLRNVDEAEQIKLQQVKI